MKNRFMSFVHPDSQEMSDPNPVPKLVGARKRDVKMTRSMVDDSRCFARAGFFSETKNSFGFK